MLSLAVLFFLIAVLAAVFGFTGVAVAAAGIAKIVFIIFLVLFVLALIGRRLSQQSRRPGLRSPRRSPPTPEEERPMVPPTTVRVSINTHPSVNDCIDERTRENVARYAGSTPALIEERLRELAREWDVERITAAVAGFLSLTGVLLAWGLGTLWLVVPFLVAIGLVLHAVIGWSPLLPLVRRLGCRTACEICHERYALKALRGDFQRLDVVTTPQDREDLARFEGEGGAVAPPPGPDAADPAAVHEAIQAVKS